VASKGLAVRVLAEGRSEGDPPSRGGSDRRGRTICGKGRRVPGLTRRRRRLALTTATVLARADEVIENERRELLPPGGGGGVLAALRLALRSRNSVAPDRRIYGMERKRSGSASNLAAFVQGIQQLGGLDGDRNMRIAIVGPMST